MERGAIEQAVLRAAKTVAKDHNLAEDRVSAKAVFFGQGGLFDSLALVQLLVEIEDRFQADHRRSIVLTDERAMSQTSSPFRSVQALTDYIAKLLASA